MWIIVSFEIFVMYQNITTLNEILLIRIVTRVLPVWSSYAYICMLKFM